MKITIVYRYFWPDTPPYASMLLDIASWLVEAGHEVNIITAQPSYKPDANIAQRPWRENINGVSVQRVWLFNERGNGLIKILNSLLFIFSAFFICLWSRKRDLYWTATMPPILQALMIGLCARLKRAKFVYHMQDIYPEIASVSPNVKTVLPVSWLVKLDRYTQKHANAIVVLSQDMADSIVQRGVNAKKIRIINNFNLIDLDQNAATENKSDRTDSVRFLFAGNLGRFQNLDALVSAFALLKDQNITLDLVGEGRVKQALIQRVNDNAIENVRFFDHMSLDEVSLHMRKCDVGIVSLLPGVYRYAFPSKVLTYMSANLPIFAMVEEQSELAKMLKNEQVGFAIDWNCSSKQIAAALEEVGRDVGTRFKSPADAVHIYEKNTAREKWCSLVETLEVSK